MTLSFLALSVIPSLKITDRGLVDVDAFQLVPLELNGRIVYDRETFVERFGALYEHSPWVAERAWQPDGFEGVDELGRGAAGAMYARVRGRQARADPRPSGPRREGRRAHRALALRAGRAGPRPARAGRVRALHGHQRRLPREVRDPVRGLRARAHEGLDPRQRRRPAGQLPRARRSRPRSARSPRSPGCDWRTRCEPLHARARHGPRPAGGGRRDRAAPRRRARSRRS